MPIWRLVVPCCRPSFLHRSNATVSVWNSSRNDWRHVVRMLLESKIVNQTRQLTYFMCINFKLFSQVLTYLKEEGVWPRKDKNNYTLQVGERENVVRCNVLNTNVCRIIFVIYPKMKKFFFVFGWPVYLWIISWDSVSPYGWDSIQFASKRFAARLHSAHSSPLELMCVIENKHSCVPNYTFCIKYRFEWAKLIRVRKFTWKVVHIRPCTLCPGVRRNLPRAPNCNLCTTISISIRWVGRSVRVPCHFLRKSDGEKLNWGSWHHYRIQ